ncbi:MAG: hypothetical protein E7562_01950 [Ruminococcaceae bacterium]|nr:hypothetical protein [Oscillospiraceae bacterium]
MRHRFAAVLVIILSLVLCTGIFAPAPAVVAETKKDAVLSDEKVNAARFLNMLNHNSSYNDDFFDVDVLVNNAVLQLLDLRSAEDEDFIAVGFVAEYMKDMYGIEIVDVSALNAEFPQKEGHIFIVPRGFSTYTHEFVSARENEDGSFTVETKVTVDYHDGKVETVSAVSLFVVNEASAFGYNLVYSNLLINVNAM